MSISLLFQKVAVGNGSTHAITVAGNTAGVDCFVACTVDYGPSTPGVLTDLAGNTWIPVTAYGGGAGARVLFYYCLGPTTDPAHTFDFGGTAAYPALSILGFSGVKSSGALDLNDGNALSSVAIQPLQPAATPAEDNEVCVFFVGGLQVSTVGTDTGAMINQAPAVAGVNFGIASAYIVQTTATLLSPALGWTENADVAAAFISLKAAPEGGGGGSAPPFIPLISRFAPHRAAGY